jgi:hypothetical protein
MESTLYHIKLTVLYCDKTTVEKEYDATSMANLTAKEDFYAMCDEGHENDTVFGRNKSKHIRHVQLVFDGAPEEANPQETFHCPHDTKLLASV